MPDFSITDEKIAYIAKQFRIEERYVRSVYHIFSSVMGNVKNQYLAHIIRCMETYIRQKTQNPMFQINTFPIDENSPVLNVGCAQYFPSRYFSIFFHPRMEEKQLRVCLSHELGHLFIIELLNEGQTDKTETYDETALTEPLSSIFGIFTMMDKNLFYENAASRFNHHSAQELIQDFVHLQNRLVN
jgi:uncharacterized protein YjaZ